MLLVVLSRHSRPMALPLTGLCNVEGGGTFTGGDEKSGPQFNNLLAFSGTGAENIQIGFNGAEPGSGRDLTFTELRLTLYGTDGTALYSTSGFSCATGLAGCTNNGNGTITIDTQPGQGNFGYIFQLSADQAQALNSAGPGRIGLLAYITDSFGSEETFFVAAGPGGRAVVPEPMTFAIMGSGLLALGLMRRFS